MTSRPHGPTLAERSAAAGVGRGRPPGGRHCWVSGLPGSPGRWPGLVAEWARRDGSGWSARVVYAVDDDSRVVLVEAWVPARHLTAAGE